jgi:hypothetical protein
MACVNAHAQLSTSPTLLYSVPVENPAKKAILNINVANFNTTTEDLISMYAVPAGGSTTTLSLTHFLGAIPLRVKGNISGVAEMTGKAFAGGYTLMATANTTNCVVFVSGEQTLNLD